MPTVPSSDDKTKVKTFRLGRTGAKTRYVFTPQAFQCQVLVLGTRGTGVAIRPLRARAPIKTTVTMIRQASSVKGHALECGES